MLVHQRVGLFEHAALNPNLLQYGRENREMKEEYVRIYSNRFHSQTKRTWMKLI